MSSTINSVTAHRLCCRLCLAPDSECVPIMKTEAADKEPIAQKINFCVSIKVQEGDRLSLRICHACISYLNSWQSFKNRCHAAQRKQRSWSEQWQQQQKFSTSDEQALATQQLLQLNTSVTTTSGDNERLPYQKLEDASVDISFIKKEPEEIGDENGLEENQNGDVIGPISMLEDGPPILTSLGLTHINHVNPFSFLSTELGHDSIHHDVSMGDVPRAQCTVCHMKFSNRANARRHERNIHGKILNPVSQLMNHTNPIKKSKLMVPPPTYDYDQPEQYRPLLVDSKLSFIKRHIPFLDQYQTMTCTCCNRQFSSYKLFMAHMRKKYSTLSKNLCFKCLKQFQSKAQFIAHLKKKNCINLYRIYNALPDIGKNPSPALGSKTGPKAGPKEIISNKVYGCKLCTKTFRVKVDFRSHVYEAHDDAHKTNVPVNACSFCLRQFDDSSARRRHYNNMECIVFLVCGTCDTQFDKHADYIEHVYATHLQMENGTLVSNLSLEGENSLNMSHEENESELEKSGFKQPQSCKVCGKQYNNYYNVLRHMESKHPDQLPSTYQCHHCDVGFCRQTALREHLIHVHGETAPKLPTATFSNITIDKNKRKFTCKQCDAIFESKDMWLDHQENIHFKYSCMWCDIGVIDRDLFERHLEEKHSNQGQENYESDDDGQDDEEAAMSRGGIELNGNDTANHGFADDDMTMNNDDDLDEDDDDEVMEVQEMPRKRIRLETNKSHLPVRECPVCHVVFHGGIALANHMRTHYNNSSGNVSNQSMSVSANLDPSKQIRLPTNRMRCRICQKRIHSKQTYKRHMLTEHQIKDCIFMRCKLCPAEFSNDKGLKVHMFRTHNISVQQMAMDVSLFPTPKQESTVLSASELDETPPAVAASNHFECDICHTVYRNREQLRAHKQTVHLVVGDENVVNVDVEDDVQKPLETFYQCRYCIETFNSSKRLTIHMNTHEQHDSKNNTCNDCGNVYSTRKSLWVHRHKKHPRPPDPSQCEVCRKVFFDKTELFHHLQTHRNEAGRDQLQRLNALIAQKTKVAATTAAATNVEDYTCHLCGLKYFDKRVLSKHLRLHEMNKTEVNEDSTASGGGSALPEYTIPYQNQMVNGEYACDMCPKTFPALSALKVHRGWHFRSPDGRQVTDTNNMWQPDQGSTSTPYGGTSGGNSSHGKKRWRPANPPVCPYCKASFASGNNLRRHIVEVHKRNEARMQRENGVKSPGVEVDKENECLQCELAFDTRLEWVEHKLMHARNMKPSTTFEWGCSICGKFVTRKERLLAHMMGHLKEDPDNPMQSGNEFESNSQSSMSEDAETNDRHVMPNREVIKVDADDDDDDEDDDDDDEEDDEDVEVEPSVNNVNNGNNLNEVDYDDDEDDDEDGEVDGEEEDEDDDEEDDDDDDDEEDDDDGDENTPIVTEVLAKAELKSDTDDEDGRYSCDLCQVFYKTAKELRKHVASHIN